MLPRQALKVLALCVAERAFWPAAQLACFVCVSVIVALCITLLVLPDGMRLAHTVPFELAPRGAGHTALVPLPVLPRGDAFAVAVALRAVDVTLGASARHVLVHADLLGISNAHSGELPPRCTRTVALLSAPPAGQWRWWQRWLGAADPPPAVAPLPPRVQTQTCWEDGGFVVPPAPAPRPHALRIILAVDSNGGSGGSAGAAVGVLEASVIITPVRRSGALRKLVFFTGPFAVGALLVAVLAFASMVGLCCAASALRWALGAGLGVGLPPPRALFDMVARRWGVDDSFDDEHRVTARDTLLPASAMPRGTGWEASLRIAHHHDAVAAVGLGGAAHGGAAVAVVAAAGSVLLPEAPLGRMPLVRRRHE